MPSVQSRLYKTELKGQSQETVANIVQFMQNEANGHKFLIPVSKVHKHVASTAAVSNSSPKTTRKGMLNLQVGKPPPIKHQKDIKTGPSHE
jgi:hypothetical protein